MAGVPTVVTEGSVRGILGCVVDQSACASERALSGSTAVVVWLSLCRCSFKRIVLVVDVSVDKSEIHIIFVITNFWPRFLQRFLKMTTNTFLRFPKRKSPCTALLLSLLTLLRSLYRILSSARPSRTIQRVIFGRKYRLTPINLFAQMSAQICRRAATSQRRR